MGRLESQIADAKKKLKKVSRPPSLNGFPEPAGARGHSANLSPQKKKVAAGAAQEREETGGRCGPSPPAGQAPGAPDRGGNRHPPLLTVLLPGKATRPGWLAARLAAPMGARGSGLSRSTHTPLLQVVTKLQEKSKGATEVTAEQIYKNWKGKTCKIKTLRYFSSWVCARGAILTFSATFPILSRPPTPPRARPLPPSTLPPLQGVVSQGCPKRE